MTTNNKPKRLFFSMADVNFASDAAIEEFARRVWEQANAEFNGGGTGDDTAGDTGKTEIKGDDWELSAMIATQYQPCVTPPWA